MDKGKKTTFRLCAAAGCSALLLTIRLLIASRRTIDRLKDELVKFHEFYDALIKWVKLNINEKRIEDYFVEHGYKTVAIYGFGDIGECLFKELSKSDLVKVKYIIDKNSLLSSDKVKVITTDDYLDPVDVIIVTAIHYYDDVLDVLENKISCPIISIEDVLFG